MLHINGHPLADPTCPYVIAEISANHCQSLDVTRKLLDTLACTGVQAVKFQTYQPDELAVSCPIPSGYDTDLDARRVYPGAVLTLREHLAEGGFPRAWHVGAARHAASVGLTFLSTPFSVDAAKFLVEEVGVPALKIASGDLTFAPLLEYAAGIGLPLLLSCGGATLEELTETVTHWLAGCGPRLIVLWCRSIYPCPPAYANVAAIRTLRQQFPQIAALGWSDHTTDALTVPTLAWSAGATVFEKHVRLPNEGEPLSIDAAHSITPAALQAMVLTLQAASAIMGDGQIGPHALERHERLWARRGTDGKRPTDAARAGVWQ